MPADAHELVRLGTSLFTRGLTHGRTGNLSVRRGDVMLITPTGASLGALNAERLARVSLDGRHAGGPVPSKEAVLHAAMYRARAEARAVVHLHSPYSVALSTLADVDPADVLPPLTAYFAMRVRALPLLPFHAPGDPALGPLVEAAAAEHQALLLANHGPIVAGTDLTAAADMIEELEATARLHLLVRGLPTRPLTPEQVSGLRR